MTPNKTNVSQRHSNKSPGFFQLRSFFSQSKTAQNAKKTPNLQKVTVGGPTDEYGLKKPLRPYAQSLKAGVATAAANRSTAQQAILVRLIDSSKAKRPRKTSWIFFSPKIKQKAPQKVSRYFNLRWFGEPTHLSQLFLANVW